jgi:hypothetical protein
MAFSFAGSLMWEMFGENHSGAINDWAQTSLGGIAVGETLHRTARMVRDNTARGAGRTFLELGAMLIDPVGGFNRIVRGEASRVGPNPADRFPKHGGTVMRAGLRTMGEGRLADSERAVGYVEIAVEYGDPFVEHERPFDSFEFSIQWNRQEKVPIGRMHAEGVLWGKELKQTESAGHLFAVHQIFDYMENKTYEVGGQTFGFTLHSKYMLSDELTLATRIQPTVAFISAVNSEYEEFTGREYDFGSGLGFRARAQLNRAGFNFLTAGYAGAYTHTMNGAPGNQVVHYTYVRAQYPLWESVGVGVDYYLFLRNSYYRDFPNVHRRNPELRVNAVFSW